MSLSKRTTPARARLLGRADLRDHPGRAVAAAGRVLGDAVDAELQKALAPQGYGLPPDLNLSGDLLVPSPA